MNRPNPPIRHRRILVALTILVTTVTATQAGAIGFPVHQIQGRWTPTEMNNVHITGLRVNLVPSIDELRDRVIWTVDETMVIRNFSDDTVEFSIAIPNAWSENTGQISTRYDDFWGQASVNGEERSTEVTDMVINPAFPDVTYRNIRVFRIELESGQSKHVRLQFALPSEATDDDERMMVFPFGLRPLWDGPIEAGVIVLRWTEQMYSFRTNLPSYALYRDRAEWFVRDFEPETNLEVRFLPRQAVFTLVAAELGCPTSWELLDRISEGSTDLVSEMLSGYTTNQLEVCAELPAALRGSTAAARAAGISAWRLEQFVSDDSGISGPLFVADPTYRNSDLPDAERIYARFLRQEVARRL